MSSLNVPLHYERIYSCCPWFCYRRCFQMISRKCLQHWVQKEFFFFSSRRLSRSDAFWNSQAGGWHLGRSWEAGDDAFTPQQKAQCLHINTSDSFFLEVSSTRPLACCEPSRNVPAVFSLWHFWIFILGGWQDKFQKMSRATNLYIYVLTHNPPLETLDFLHVRKQHHRVVTVVKVWLSQNLNNRMFLT